jgi:hypothetical protein
MPEYPQIADSKEAGRVTDGQFEYEKSRKFSYVELFCMPNLWIGKLSIIIILCSPSQT